jgi:hypothetical protein
VITDEAVAGYVAGAVDAVGLLMHCDLTSVRAAL